LELGKESGDIEYAAGSVLALLRGEWQQKFSEMHLALAKVRGGGEPNNDVRRDWSEQEISH